MMPRVLPFLLVAVSIGAYCGLLASGELEFVFDDLRFIRDNPAIRDLGSTPEFFTNPATADAGAWAGIYRPLRTLDFAIDWAIVGENEGVGRIRWFHLRNILYHSASALLVYLLFCQWGARQRWAALGAMVFALHPVQAEAVGWITSRADVLSMVLILSALLCHGRSRKLDRYTALSAGFLLLALLAKEVAVVFIGMVVLSDFMFRDQQSIRRTFRRWPTYIVYGAVVGAFILLWLNRHQAHGGDGLAGASPLGQLNLEQFLTVARALVYYARVILLPVDLTQDYYLPKVGTLDLPTVGCVILVLGAALWAAVDIVRRGSYLAFAMLWFFITIFPTTSLFVPLGIATADRFLYLPLIGFAFCAGSVLNRVAARGVPGMALTAITLSCLFLLTFARAQVWANGDALWNSTRRYYSPRATEWFAEVARSEAEDLLSRERSLREKGEVEEADQLRAEAHRLLWGAIEDYNGAIDFWEKTSPRWEQVLIVKALQSVCIYDLGRFEDALANAEFCVERWQDMELGHYARSLGLLGLGRLREAAAANEVTLAISNRPEYREAGAEIHERLARFYEQRGNEAQAFVALRRSWELLPSEELNETVFRDLSRLDREYRDQVDALEAAIRRNPRDGDARLRLACAHASFGNYEVSGSIFNDLLRQDGADRAPHVMVPYALCFWQSRDTAEGYERAIEIYGLILEADPTREDVREQLEISRRARSELPE